MTKEEIDQQLDEMTAKAAKGDKGLLPGLLMLNDRLYGTDIRTETTSAAAGAALSRPARARRPSL